MKFYPVTRTRLFSLMLALLGLLSSFIPASVPERGKSPAPGVRTVPPIVATRMPMKPNVRRAVLGSGWPVAGGALMPATP